MILVKILGLTGVIIAILAFFFIVAIEIWYDFTPKSYNIIEEQMRVERINKTKRNCLLTSLFGLLLLLFDATYYIFFLL